MSQHISLCVLRYCDNKQQYKAEQRLLVLYMLVYGREGIFEKGLSSARHLNLSNTILKLILHVLQ